MKPSQGWSAKMIKVTVSKEARKDLVNIHRYISEELENPQAANRIIHELRSAAEDLQLFPRRGRPLDALISVHTEYRYLPCENYCIFYLEDEENVVIVRILHLRQDYLRALFGL